MQTLLHFEGFDKDEIGRPSQGDKTWMERCIIAGCSFGYKTDFSSDLRFLTEHAMKYQV